MLKVYVDHNGEDGHWFYYYYDSGNFKITAEGFETHILAKEHAINNINQSIEFLYK